MNSKCLRCKSALKDVTPEDVSDIRFLSCENCPCQYTENEHGRIHDRWLMPITLPLYSVIYAQEPSKSVDGVVKKMLSRQRGFIDVLIEHISAELETPTQKLTDIHEFIYADEDQLREFLSLVKSGLERELSK